MLLCNAALPFLCCAPPAPPQGDVKEAKGRAEAKGEDTYKKVEDSVKGAADELKP